jgi:hypothetical protein
MPVLYAGPQVLPYHPELRGFGFASEDASRLKTFALSERCRLRLRAEFTNVFKRHAFENPDTDINSKTFGQVKSVSGSPRNGQVGARLDW